jgi:hypothetical protein
MHSILLFYSVCILLFFHQGKNAGTHISHDLMKTLIPRFNGQINFLNLKPHAFIYLKENFCFQIKPSQFSHCLIDVILKAK